LRDNHTTDQFPDGVYHPHKGLHHIKKENIGLIEVMGLAILPPRLKDELLEVEKYLQDEYNSIADYHKEWADQIKVAGAFDRASVHDYVQEQVGQVFVKVLEDAGVYKNTAEGKVGFARFISNLGLKGE
ncbi:MAG: UDP-glucose--hexose-1-phosphate uridylyltransferase, partial [Streptococcus parauberis]